MQTNEKPGGGRSRDRVKEVTRVRVRGVIRVRDRVRASDECVILFQKHPTPYPPKKVEKSPI